MNDYQEFLESKLVIDRPSGFEKVPALHPSLFDFQRDIVAWGLKRGRAAVWADCGLGKSRQQIEWCAKISEAENKPSLILAPLAVASQTKTEGEQINVEVTKCRSENDVRPGVNITNYEMMHHFDLSKFVAVALDESSILKSMSGKYRNDLVTRCARIPYRSAWTATPAPNDWMELGNHAEFLGVMSRNEMLAMFFTRDGGESQTWRLKGHAESEFWKWMASWAVNIRHPSDLGYSDEGFDLPELRLHEHIVESAVKNDGFLFSMPAATLDERRAARRNSLSDRVNMAAEIIGNDPKPWLIWCDLNNESKALSKLLDAVEVTGSDEPEKKEKALIGFAEGSIRRLVSKPSIAGMGLNLQICHKMIFVGLSDSYEAFYQAVRRSWRFGQKKPVDAHIIIADTEGAVLANIKRKDAQAKKMSEEMVRHMAAISRSEIRQTTREKSEYVQTIKIKLPSFL